MAMKTTIPFSIFVPKSPSHRPTTELRFSRWNNANAEKFLRVERAQKEIEDEIRRERRYESASKIAYNDDVASTSTTVDNESFKSIGTPSSPSRPSIPGKSSKYSESHNSNANPKFSHPAFRRVSRISKISKVPVEGTTGVSVGENGVSYRVPNAPFEFQYSYTETPKVKPLALREPPFLPFGPSTMPRPWTGRAPLPPSKKKLPEFDSFRLPPPHKKGVKPVQAPGPFIAGSGPRYVKSREEVLGEPLTDEEIKNLIQSCLKTKRQLNMGRDGLTHNMLDNIHAHWKRRRVCKIKCKGVCTVDMDNVFQQLEEKTGGKIIYSRGGVLFLFRGRNYNYRFRPRYPLMLWKPVTPVYPRLIQHAPEGLTLQEASEMRKKGRKLPPICKLGKNGVYSDLVKNVKEAFEVCELVRINCQGFNKSDYKKIGAKLKDLVPCVLMSFEHEHILLWRGRDWISSLPHPKDDCEKGPKKSDTDNETTTHPLDYSDSMTTTDQGSSELCARKNSSEDINFDASKIPLSSMSSEGAIIEETKDALSLLLIEKNDAGSAAMNTHASEIPSNNTGVESEGSPAIPGSTCTEGVLLLLKQAIENGSAVLLDDVFLDANIVYERAVSLAKIAPSGPIFRVRPRKVLVQKREKQESEDSKVEVVPGLGIEGSKKKNSRIQKFKDLKNTYPETVPHGSLKVDELAKLLL